MEEQGAKTFSVNSTRQLTRLNDCGTESILVARPQTREELQIAADLSPKSSLLWTIDHYIHAEHLAAVNCPQTQEVLIQLQSDQPGIGVRPGTDAIQLAQGVERLEGIRVVGISVHASQHDDLAALIQATQHTCTAFRKRGICCDTVSLSTSRDVFPSASGPFTELHANVVTGNTFGPIPNTTQTATVVSRPSLEHVVFVLDDVEAAGKLIFPDYPLAEVRQWQRDCCVITAAGAAERLNIGDRMDVVIQN